MVHCEMWSLAPEKSGRNSPLANQMSQVADKGCTTSCPSSTYLPIVFQFSYNDLYNMCRRQRLHHFLFLSKHVCLCLLPMVYNDFKPSASYTFLCNIGATCWVTRINCWYISFSHVFLFLYIFNGYKDMSREIQIVFLVCPPKTSLTLVTCSGFGLWRMMAVSPCNAMHCIALQWAESGVSTLIHLSCWNPLVRWCLQGSLLQCSAVQCSAVQCLHTAVQCVL